MSERDLFDSLSGEDEREELIEQLTAGLQAGLYVEKRFSEASFHPALLLPPDPQSPPVKVLICGQTGSAGGHVLITETSFEEMARADLSVRVRAGRVDELSGWAETSRLGRRKADRDRNPPLYFSVFYPNHPWRSG